ncbi:hypothetical protein DPMN_155622 [Dreissena polymorpha]|uniref:Uncharacterized protein n=1 Tax=Dreissena polymorpha TaxID=45954 RepID=A0A9D4FP67_DREPO|nr:hypothetical protein DPMN_155622 [Dreissena polymorpha]
MGQTNNHVLLSESSAESATNSTSLPLSVDNNGVRTNQCMTFTIVLWKVPVDTVTMDTATIWSTSLTW